jgi:hypothetical protein
MTESFLSVINDKEARAKGISLCSNNKARVFGIVEDHKDLMFDMITFKPNPKLPPSEAIACVPLGQIAPRYLFYLK